MLIQYDSKYCDKHLFILEEKKSKANHYYNNIIRNTEENKKFTDFYKTKSWLSLRKLFAIKNPLCEICLDNGTIKTVEIVHHKIEIRKDFSRRLDENNLQSVCKVCHNKIHK
jgi:5-methylcytosine-specific restriction protein A